MRRVVLSFGFLVTMYAAFSQRIYFIYLQTESQQPFFVKMDEKLYSSTASGYLILSRLKDSTYNFTIGFPGNQTGEQKFSCTVNKKDHGYLIKNFGEKGWGLYDLQTSTVQMALNAGNNKTASVSNGAVNPFTELLAKAADDSTLKQKIIVPEEKKAETASRVKADSALNTAANKAAAVQEGSAGAEKKAIAVNDPVKPAGSGTAKTPETGKPVMDPDAAGQDASIKKNDTAESTAAGKTTPDTAKLTADKVKKDIPEGIPDSGSFARTQVIHKPGAAAAEEFETTYVDVQEDGTQDTIKIIIPDNGDKTQAVEIKDRDTAVKKNGEAVDSKPVIAAGTTVKNDCRQVASDADFYKLRKKMAAAKSDDAMISEAGKAFKIKCFTANQVKNLSSLFLGDGGKYNFFDMAYAHVADTGNFPALQSELKDEYFINRFKAMLK